MMFFFRRKQASSSLRKYWAGSFACLSLFSGVSGPVLANNNDVSRAVVNVRDFGAIPDDKNDDAVAIQKAFNYAKQTNQNSVVFEAGNYDLVTVGNTSLNCYSGLSGANNLTISGATDATGNPVTRLVKHHNSENNVKLPGHLRFDNCRGITIENLVFDNYPAYATAGEVIEKGADYVVVSVFEGLPAVNGMGAYCANSWNLSTKDLNKVPSLSFISDVADNSLYWQLLEERNNRKIVRMNNTGFASKLNQGDGISWHFGAQTMFQLALNTCSDVVLKNILTVNIAGWGIHTYACNNIEASKIIFKTTGNQLAVGPRDAWKINQCNGQVVIDGMEVNGVRWDGQNIHGIFFKAVEKVASDKIKVSKQFASVANFLNDSIGFWNGGEEKKFLAIGWELLEKSTTELSGIIQIKGDVPEFVQNGTLIGVDAWDCDSYTVNNSSFKNIAGCASVIKNKKARFNNVSYDHIMYPAVMIGTEVGGLSEATFSQDLIFNNCSFSSSGWIKRIGREGLIGIGNDTNRGMTMGDIQFNDCEFKDAALGLDITAVKTLTLRNPVFTNVALRYKTDQSNTGNVYLINDNPEPPPATFSADNLLLVRVGNGSTTLSSSSAPVFLDEYSISGSLIQSVPLPVEVSGSNKRLTLSGTQADEGYISLSPDGQQCALFGYDAEVGTASLITTPSSSVSRIIAVVKNDKSIDTRTAISNQFSGVVARSATVSGNNLWATGGGSGILHTTIGTNGGTLISSKTGRVLSIYNNQLYASSIGENLRLATVGNGMPVSSGQILTNLPGFPTSNPSNPFQYVFTDQNAFVAGPDVLYVADAGGMQKYSLLNGTWVLNGTLTGSYYGLTGRLQNSTAFLYATRKNGSGAFELISTADNNGYNAGFSGTVSVKATATGGTVFRGLSFTPGTKVLPVTLHRFGGKIEGGKVIISWTTLSEKNNSHFEILRSADGKSFLPIVQVAGAGDSNRELKYSYTDSAPLNGTSYYRLKQVDKDGKSTDSSVISIKGDLKLSEFLVAPDNDGLRVSFFSEQAGPAKLIVYDISGRKICEEQVALVQGKQQLPMKGCRPAKAGVYVITLSSTFTMAKTKFQI